MPVLLATYVINIHPLHHSSPPSLLCSMIDLFLLVVIANFRKKMGTFRNLVFMVVVLLYYTAAEGGAEYLTYKDPKQPLNARISDLLSRMTLAEKIGQIAQIEREVATPQVLKDHFIGIQSQRFLAKSDAAA